VGSFEDPNIILRVRLCDCLSVRTHETTGQFVPITMEVRCRGSSVSIVSDYALDDWWSEFDPRQRRKDFSLASVSRPALGPTQPAVKCITGILSPGLKRGRGVTLTTHPHLVPRSRMSRNEMYLLSPKRLRGVLWNKKKTWRHTPEDSHLWHRWKFIQENFPPLGPSEVVESQILTNASELLRYAYSSCRPIKTDRHS
jgi:hypothetical protein